jgi:hypothetical protein
MESGAAAGTGGSATGTSRTEIESTIELESVDQEVNLYRFGFFKEILADQVLESVDIENLIVVFWLIQSHCQTGAASAAFVQEDPDRTHFLPIKVCSYLLRSRGCHFQHNTLLRYNNGLLW